MLPIGYIERVLISHYTPYPINSLLSRVVFENEDGRVYLEVTMEYRYPATGPGSSFLQLDSDKHAIVPYVYCSAS